MKLGLTLDLGTKAVDRDSIPNLRKKNVSSTAKAGDLARLEKVLVRHQKSNRRPLSKLSSHSCTYDSFHSVWDRQHAESEHYHGKVCYHTFINLLTEFFTVTYPITVSGR